MPPTKKIDDFVETLTRIDERTLHMKETMDKFMVASAKRHDDLEKDVDNLRTFKTYVKGSWAVISIIGLAIWQFFTGSK